MIVCIDLDNTILDHKRSFNKAYNLLLTKKNNKNLFEKEEIKEKIIKRYDHKKWKKTQGLVYGKFIRSECEVYPGFKEFCVYASLLGHKIFIISHKTKTGHYLSKRINLRKEAEKVLKIKLGDVYKNINKIHFCDTFNKKIELIKKYKPDIVVDDLEDVLVALKNNSQKILFKEGLSDKNNSNFKILNWTEINVTYLLKYKKTIVSNLIKKMTKQQPSRLTKINDGGNSILYKYKQKKVNYKIKIYLNNNFDTFQREKNVYKKINSSFEYLRPIKFSNSIHRANIFEWEKGNNFYKVDHKYIDNSIDFLIKLNSPLIKKKLKNIGYASAACTSGLESLNQLSNRNSDLNQKLLFKTNIINKINLLVKNKLKLKKSSKFLNHTKSLSTQSLIISPSDFGKHNAIKFKKNYKYFDFEYLGLDDPIKLLSDFYFHPAMELNLNYKNYWISKFNSNFYSLNYNRLFFLLPIYGLIWTHIIIKDFTFDNWNKKKLIKNISNDEKKLLFTKQINKVKFILKSIELFEMKYNLCN